MPGGAGGWGAGLTAPSPACPILQDRVLGPCSILAEAARLAKQRLAEEELRAQALREREREKDAPQLEQGELETEPGELPTRKKPKHERIVWRGAPGGSWRPRTVLDRVLDRNRMAFSAHGVQA